MTLLPLVTAAAETLEVVSTAVSVVLSVGAVGVLLVLAGVSGIVAHRRSVTPDAEVES